MGGRLVLVVGPSGAGKDTLLEEARQRLAGDPHYHFPRRYITRPADAGGENHVALSDVEFTAAANRGAFALQWSAHGLRYGIDAAVAEELMEGRCVVVNTSRTIVDEARRDYPMVRIIHVTAKPAILQQRLRARGREAANDVADRLRRETPPIDGPDVYLVRNDGALETALDQFVNLLRVFARERPAQAPRLHAV